MMQMYVLPEVNILLEGAFSLIVLDVKAEKPLRLCTASEVFL